MQKVVGFESHHLLFFFFSMDSGKCTTAHPCADGRATPAGNVVREGVSLFRLLAAFTLDYLAWLPLSKSTYLGASGQVGHV